jgi:hypothetical protein
MNQRSEPAIEPSVTHGDFEIDGSIFGGEGNSMEMETIVKLLDS